MNKVFIFAMGVAVGSVATWKIVETKYKKLADEEIESVKEVFKNRNNKENDEGSEMLEHEEKREVYADSISDLEYADNDSEENDIYTIKTEELEDHMLPYVISPDEFEELPGYRMESWTYYADDVLTDENDDIVSDPESIIGDALSHFGEYGYNSVCVRNDETKCDYEVIKINKTYKETHGVNN